LLPGLALLALLPAAACRPGAPAAYKRTCLLMDTYVTIQALGPSPTVDSAIDAAFARLEEISRKFNHLDTASPVFAFNARNVPLTDTEVVGVVRASVGVSEASGGAFDITVEPLVGLWGFYSDHPAVPEQRQIDSCLKLVGYRNLVVEPGRVTKRNPGTRIDLGGIAKGYALAEAARVLRARGVRSAIIDIGGDVFAIGRKGKEKWRIGVRDPRGEGVVAEVAAEDMAAVTSGDYERYFWGPPQAGSGGGFDSASEPGHVPAESVRYCHIIDPATGWPALGAASATVLMRDPLTAQGWSKVLFIRGSDALPLLERAGGIKGLLVTDEHEVIRSADWPPDTE
jgi:thiamine biosynthesis lipoprotein